ncbi:unnamed protein product [Blepharisma stoltei]|uniref:Uncharacterized protein n=1 Tax=Blepharisma stoltei TaxID=1481888 RepID=A0AAU9IX62_9CILI|nr:unnamed protein product [Blepharisma stoltei]
MSREERKSYRRPPPPIIETHEIQHGQGQEAAPLYTEEPISIEPHDFRNEVPTLEVILDAQRTPQRSELARMPQRSQNPRYSYEHSIQSDSGSVWDDPRALQMEIRKKRRQLEEAKRRCMQSESELQNERLKSTLLEEENENLRREIRRKERDRSGNQHVEGEIERIKANLAYKIKEIELMAKELQASKAEREKLKEHIKNTWQEFEAFKTQSEENRRRLQQTLDEVSANQNFVPQSEAIAQVLQQKNKIALELQKSEKKSAEMKKMIENLNSEKIKDIETKENEIKRLNEISKKQEEIILSMKQENEQLKIRSKTEHKEIQTERPPEIILPPCSEREEPKPEKVRKINHEKSPDIEEVRETPIEDIAPPPKAEEMKFEFSAERKPIGSHFEKINHVNLSDPFMMAENPAKKSKEETSYQAFQPISNLFDAESFEEDINPEITRIPPSEAKSDPEVQTWTQEENKEIPNKNIEAANFFEENTNTDFFFSTGASDATNFFDNIDQFSVSKPIVHASEIKNPQQNIKKPILEAPKDDITAIFDPKPKKTISEAPKDDIAAIFDPKPNTQSQHSKQPSQHLFNDNIESLFDSKPPQKPQKLDQTPIESFNQNIESLFDFTPNVSNPFQFNENIENTFEIKEPETNALNYKQSSPPVHKATQGQSNKQENSQAFQFEESVADFFSNVSNNKDSNKKYGNIPSSLFD